MIRKFTLALLFLLVPHIAWATITDYTITFTEQPDAISTMQFEVVFASALLGDPSQNYGVVVTEGESTLAADKSVSFNALSDTRLRIILFGLNQNTFTSGTVVNLTADVSGDTTPQPVENIVLSAPDGTSVVPGSDVLLVAIGTSTDPRAVLLTWTDSPSFDIVRYEIYQDTAPITSGSPILITIEGRENRSYTVTNLDNGTYYFRVAYLDSGGLRGWSNSVTQVIAVGPQGGVLTKTYPAPVPPQ